MATPMQLIEAVATALGVDRSTVVTHDRNLVAAGFRTKGGRGPSAARMTAADASMLLIAVATSEQIKDSVAAASAFSELLVVGTRAGSPLPSLRAGHTFGEALTEFIQCYRDDVFKFSDEFTLSFAMTRPDLHAKIEGVVGESDIDADYRPTDEQSHFARDLTTVARFSQVTIGVVGMALRD